MIMKRNIVFLIGVVCLMASCSREEIGGFRPEPTPGEEVRFSASVNENPQTKTLYGADAPDSIRVKWVNGDLISVYGNTGGKKQAEYKVVATTNPTNNPNADDGQVYADDLQKTTPSGVQWGDEETANFMAIYPSAGASFPAENQIKTTISATQNYVFSAGYKTGVLDGVDYDGNAVKIDLWEGTHFGSNATNPSMQNAIMFARTEGVANGSTVDLHFKPFSTVLKFRFMGFNSSLTNPTIYVQSIKVTAPSGTNISGDFTLTVSGSAKNAIAQAAAAGNNTNSITLNTILPGGGYIPLKAHQAIDFNVFTIPLDDVKMGGDVTKKVENGKTTYSCEYPWTIEVQTAQHGTFTYNIIPKVEGLTTLPAGTYKASKYTLAKGEIHKVKIPQLTVMGTVDWDPTQWMKNIPQPVYLSELSIPGAWYCMDDGYQGSIGLQSDSKTYKRQLTKDNDGKVTSYYTTTSTSNGIDDGLEHLYFNGVRAFNIDCRVSRAAYRALSTGNQWSDSYYTDGKYHFACSGTEDPGNYGIYMQMKEGIHVIDAMKDIVALAQANTSEYVAVVFTFAEKPSTENFVGGAHFGTINPVYISKEIKAVLENTDIAPYLYTDINSDTTIEDVLTPDPTTNRVRNIIVKINHSNKNFYSGSTFDMPSGIMASYAGMTMDGYGLDNAPVVPLSEFSTAQSVDIYNGKTIPTGGKGMTYYYHQAQKTESSETASGTTNPSVFDRMNAIESIINSATAVYDNSSHNALFQLGIGGSINDSPSTLAQTLNPKVQTLIENKLKSSPSPVGFVLMNMATDATYGLPLVKDIIEMNGKFYLKREGGDVTTGDGTNQGTTPQPTPSSNAAYAVVGGDAF